MTGDEISKRELDRAFPETYKVESNPGYNTVTANFHSEACCRFCRTGFETISARRTHDCIQSPESDHDEASGVVPTSPWEGGLDILPQLATQTQTETIEEIAGGIQQTRVVETPYQIGVEHPVMALYDLDDVAATLSFEASTREQLSDDEITMEQIESVFGRPQDGSTAETKVAIDGEE